MARKTFRSSILGALTLGFVILATLPSLSQSTAIIGNVSPGVGLALGTPLVESHSRPESIRISTDLVLVPVTVTDDLNHPQTNLVADNFAVYDAGQLQHIRYFSVEDSPISVGLILDVSASMRDKIDTERSAIEQFFRNSNPDDDYFVITFNDQPRVLSDVTQSISGVETELGLVQPSGSTALLDAVYLGVSKLRNARYARRALIIISDGGDNASRYKLREVKSTVAESDAMVYAIGIFGASPFKSFEEAMGKRWLSAITDVSGGRTTTVDNVMKLPEQCALLSRELRNQYMLGYRPSEIATDGKWHKVKVVVTDSADTERFHSYYRRGYYSSQP